MHRCSDVNSVADGTTAFGKDRRRAEPGVTLDKAYDQNAIQEEICNVIEHAGIEVRGDGFPPVAGIETDDWNLEPDQMMQAIFSSGAIGNDAISDNSIYISKILFPANRVDGDDVLDLDITSLTFTNGDSSTLSKDGLDVYKTGASLTTVVAGYGIQYPDGPGDTAFKTAIVRKSAFSIDGTGLSWTQFGSSASWSTTLNYTTDIPESVISGDQFYSAWLRIGTTGKLAPAAITYIAFSGYARIQEIYVQSGISPALGPLTLLLEYDASSIT